MVVYVRVIIVGRIQEGYAPDGFTRIERRGNPKDLTGLRFGRLVVLRIGEHQGKRRQWVCQCDCGVVKAIVGEKLVGGRQVSCGCKRLEQLKSGCARTHGLSTETLYWVLRSMMQRCSPAASKNCKHLYYSKGVRVCDEWAKDPAAFVAWAEENGYASGLMIDRIDSNGNYEPNNCRWVDALMSANNCTTNIRIWVFGEELTLSQAVRRYSKFPYGTVYGRIKRGVDPELALTQELRTRG